MTEEEYKTAINVRNIKYGTIERILIKDVGMKDSVDGWVPAVVYTGEDRFNLGVIAVFCKRKDDFLKEFEVINKPVDKSKCKQTI